MPLTLYKTFAWQTFASLRLFTCFVYVSTYCVPIAHLRQNKPFPLLYLGHAQIINELFFWKNDILYVIEFYHELMYNSYLQKYNLDFDFTIIFGKFYDKINFKYYDWDGNIKVKECLM